MKREFAKLIKLVDVTYEGESVETRERWLRNVKNSVGENAYTLDDSEEAGGYIIKEFAADELEFVELDCYTFMGSAYEEERFYDMAWVTVKEKATGDYYALATEYFDEF